uniref:Transcription termination factor 3, mitochondrial n=1 Tax=Noccaea caerulescens TaxID=107243 RepID=A0A1J3J1K9_NOCCA
MYSLILHGRRLIELQNCRHLISAAQNQNPFFAFSSCFSSAAVTVEDVGKGKTFTVSYLVDSLGLSTKLARSISKRVSIEDKGNPDSVLKLFRSHGFTDSQISDIIKDYPLLLIADAEKSLAPKLQFLQSIGASTSELTEIVSTVPKILGKKGGNTISVYYDFVKEIIEADKSFNHKTLRHSSLPQGSRQENKLRNVLVLRELGVPHEVLFPLLISDHPLVCGEGKFEESLKKVVEMGFDPKTSRFIQALRVVQRLSNKSIEEKVDVYKKLGFSVNDVWGMFKKWPVSLTHSEKKISQTFETLKKCGLHEDEILSAFKKFPQCISYSEQTIENSIGTLLGQGFSRDELTMMFKRYPQCIGLSAESMKKKTEFLVKEMNWPLKAVALFPQVFGLNMEKRVVPRCNVIKALMSKGFLGSELPSMASVLAITDEAFLNKYVTKHSDKKLVAVLMSIFTGDCVS